MSDLGPIENEDEIIHDDPFNKFKKQRTQEAMALQERGVVSNSNEIKNKLIELFTRQSTYSTSEPKFYDSSNYEIPSSVSESGSNMNVDRLEFLCQNISDRMQTLEGDIAIVKTSLFKPPEISSSAVPPPPPPPPQPPPMPSRVSSSTIPVLPPKPPSSRKHKSKPKLMKILSTSSLNPIQREKMAKTTFDKR